MLQNEPDSSDLEALLRQSKKDKHHEERSHVNFKKYNIRPNQVDLNYVKEVLVKICDFDTFCKVPGFDLDEEDDFNEPIENLDLRLLSGTKNDMNIDDLYTLIKRFGLLQLDKLIKDEIIKVNRYQDIPTPFSIHFKQYPKGKFELLIG